MHELSYSQILRLAAWCLSLLLVGTLGSAHPGVAAPQPVASSAYQRPTGVLEAFQWPDPPLPTATPTPTPTPTPAPAPTLTPTPTPAPKPAAQPAPPAQQPVAPAQAFPVAPSGDVATTLVSLTNDFRAQYGLPPLTVNGALTSAAQSYAALLAANDSLSHVGPDGSTVATRADAAGYAGWKILMENLYRGYYDASAASILQAWAESPSHLEALVSAQVTEIGIACHVLGQTRWCVQEFGSR